MSMVDMRAALLASAPAPAASTSHKQGDDGFARALEAASRPDVRAARDRSRASDDSARTAASDQSRAAQRARRVQADAAVARGSQGVGSDTKASNANDPARGAGNVGAAGKGSAGRNNIGRSNTGETNMDKNRADVSTAGASSADVSSADVSTAGAHTADDKSSDGAAGAVNLGVGSADATATAAAAAAVIALVATTTDSAGPGIASSGETSRDPAGGSQGAAALTAMTDTQTADAHQAGTVPALGTGSSPAVSAEASTAHGPGSATPTLPSGEQAAAVAIGGTNADGTNAGGANAGGGNAGGAGGQASDPGARDRTATTAASATPPLATQAPADTSVVDKVTAPVQPAQAPASQVHAMAAPEVGVQANATAAPAAPQAAAATAPNQPTFPVPLSAQLSGQMTSLRQLPQGEHILTLTVNPETFGPVRVVARITHDGVSLQLFGASEQAREALKAALPDLRRDLAGAGLESNLELGSGSGSGGKDATGDASPFADNRNGPQHSAPRPLASPPQGTANAATPSTHATHRGGIDLVL